MAKAKSSGSARSEPTTLRASVSFPRELYETLESIAKEQRVSLAWIVRDAAEQYIAHRWPLLRREAAEPDSRPT
jgi:metal-responsive CopG/Arc/MetJ family transcriptional regulator